MKLGRTSDGMGINDVADEVLIQLSEVHSRVYRNKAPKNATAPYCVFRIDSVTNSYPSDDMYLNIDIYDKTENSVRDMEELADAINQKLNHTVRNTSNLNMHYELESRQYVPPEELVAWHFVNLRYVLRVYYK